MINKLISSFQTNKELSQNSKAINILFDIFRDNSKPGPTLEEWKVFSNLLVNGRSKNSSFNKYYYYPLIQYFRIALNSIANSNRQNINVDSVINATRALIEADKDYLKIIKNEIVNIFAFFASQQENKMSEFITLISKLESKDLFKDDETFYSFLSKKSTQSPHVARGFLKSLSKTPSEKNRKLFLTKLTRIITKLKVNNKNRSIIKASLEDSETKKWIIDNLNSELLNGINRYIDFLTVSDYHANNFNIFKFFIECNKDNEQEITLQIQRRYVSYALQNYPAYERKILKFLKLPKTSPKLALSIVIENNVSPKFLISSYSELEKLAALI